MTVLNPLRGVDARIMDDADMAGPIIFVFCFGICLLFVRLTRISHPRRVLTLRRGWFSCTPKEWRIGEFQ